nr:nucleotide-binding alpha-beta plait domain-containing protein [Tanacetum cinerariifolium]
SSDFHCDKRIVWVETEGIPFKLWTENTFKRIASRWGVFLSVDDQEDLCFHSKRLCVHTTNTRSKSEDIKIIFRGKVYWIRAKETPGWVPDFADAYGDEDSDDAISNDEGDKNQNSNIFGDDDDAEDGREHQVNEDPIEEGKVMINEEVSDYPFKIYPILNDKTKNMAGKGSSSSYTRPPGFSHMKGQEDKQGMENNNTQGKEDATGLNKNDKESVQPKHIEEFSDSVSTGYFKKSEVPKTGGSILQLIDDVVKVGQVMGATGVKLMIIAVYAPHEQKEKHLLWDYLEREIKRWDSEVVTMGDFNEVRHKCERLGSVFNASEANVFNSFIVGSGLAEVVLGGKLKVLIRKIREWNNSRRSADISLFSKLKLDLESIDEIIDRGDGNDENMCKRSGIIINLNDLSNIQRME